MKTVILSTDDNKDYLGYLPYVQVAWNLLGWNTLTFYIGDQDLQSSKENRIIKLDAIEGFRNATVLQVSRLFGAKYTEGFIMTSDVDMLPLSDYWKPDQNSWTVYGEDLTNYKHYPICYICAPQNKWNEVIYENSIKELLEKYKQSKSNTFDEWWYVDQDIITERLKPLRPTSINRGFIYQGIAKGRIDRIAWKQTSQVEGIKIDAHMPRPFNEKPASDLILKHLGDRFN